jgi:hypothetical protein
MLEIVTFAKDGGPLTKSIGLTPDGKLHSDASQCVMANGTARRTVLPDVIAFADHIGQLKAHEAIALGRLRADLPDLTRLTTKRRLNGADDPTLIARTSDFIGYQPAQPALLLLDFDTKSMQPAVRERLDALGGFARAVRHVAPDIAMAGRVLRRSTSAGLKRSDTGADLLGSDGVHLFVVVRDGADVERALRTLHDRCWLAGLGWMMVGAAGQLLERSIVDRMVGAGERLVFEGPPVLQPPLVQDTASRRPQARDGAALDSLTAIPDLSPLERVPLERMKAEAARQLALERAEARREFIARQFARLIARGVTPQIARHTVERWCEGTLLPDVVLPFDLDEFAGCTVAEVLADPERFSGATMADPMEGIDYGVGKARVQQRDDGSLWIHSFAHGRTIYDLRLNATLLHAALATITDGAVIERFVQLARTADINATEREIFRKELAKRCGLGLRAVNKAIDDAEAAHAARQAQTRAEEAERERAARGDMRPRFRRPAEDTPYLTVAAQLDAVLARSTAAEPPMRNSEGYLTEIHARGVSGMHELTASGSNAEEPPPDRLPAPEHLLLTTLSDIEVAELIERHVDYVNRAGRSVRLHGAFVKAYRRRRNNAALPPVHAIAIMPVVLPDGALLSGHYLDRERHILFRVPEELEALLPQPAACTSDAVAEAIHYLTDDWLVDVAADYSGKLKLLALGCTILQRSLLEERPTYFVTAGQRGGGKTTVVTMISLATLGQRTSAAAWSFDAEERRKALLSYFGEGVSLIAWDNIPRGATISCPSIEKSLTSLTYSDRVLGVSETRTVPATSIMAFTGNNIAPKGDLASRSLLTRLTTDRPDPENRSFVHADPIGWTYANRGRILSALYTVLLGNPRLCGKDRSPASTRFKAWWHLIGAALENAAREHCRRPSLHDRTTPPELIDFGAQFLTNDDADEQGEALAVVLTTLRRWFPDSYTGPRAFRASEMVEYATAATRETAEFLSALETASGRPNPQVISATTLTWRLKALADASAWVGDQIMSLCYVPHPEHGGMFHVRPLP